MGPELPAHTLTAEQDVGVVVNAEFLDFTYDTTESSVTITGYTGSDLEITIPSEIEGLPVIAIGPGAFAGTNLRTVVMPIGLTEIAERAFSGCVYLESVSMGEGLKLIGDSAFARCSFSRLVIPHGVTAIGRSAFRGCSNLEHVQLPETLSSLGESVFSHCTNLRSVAIPNAVPVIPNSAFFNCASLVAVNLPDELLSIGSSAFYGCGKLESLTIPAGVADVASSAFFGCAELGSIYFLGNSPAASAPPFENITSTIYFKTESQGWGNSFRGRPTASYQHFDIPQGMSALADLPTEASRILKQGDGTLFLNAANSHRGGTIVEAGRVVVRDVQALGFGSLEISTHASVSIETDHEKLVVTSLALASSAKLDVGTNRVVVAANTLGESEVQAALATGRSNGSWDGVTGITSTAAPIGSHRAVGYRMSEDILEVGWAAVGDTNMDGVIDLVDLVSITSSAIYGTSLPARWQHGDTNYDGALNVVDLVAIMGTGLYGKGSYYPSRSSPQSPNPFAGLEKAFIFAAIAAEDQE